MLRVEPEGDLGEAAADAADLGDLAHVGAGDADVGRVGDPVGVHEVGLELVALVPEGQGEGAVDHVRRCQEEQEEDDQHRAHSDRRGLVAEEVFQHVFEPVPLVTDAQTMAIARSAQTDWELSWLGSVLPLMPVVASCML